MVAAQLTHHPLVACVEQVSAVLSEVCDYEPLYLDTDAKKTVLLGIAEAERRLAGLKLKTMAAAGDVAEDSGARDVAAWTAAHTRAEVRPLRQQQKLARAIDDHWARVGAAMTDGTVSLEQALVIVRGLEALPDHLGLEVIADAEARLVDYARTCNPTELALLADRILFYVAPEIAEAEEAKRLEEEEQQAHDKTTLRTKRLGHGWTRTTIIHPDASADRLQTYCEAFTSPRKRDDALGGEEDRIPYPRRMGLAFGALLEHLDPARLPAHGGDATTLLVTIPLASLQTDLGVGHGLSGATDLSASQIRRLACTAKIIPAVLGARSEILDLGRTRRLFSPAQRRAMALRDKTCRAEGCTIPATWTEAHHLRPWSQGGNTDLDDGILACSHHHHLLHNPRYTYEVRPDGRIRFHRKR
ncbi:DUF222 domain-containing protein [Nocardioides sp. MH1]|uniref:HNH endonuclease signature motif containing protein n=1 Tax=Nocardioides sp. MH1 TaxID=3242490 RepID=UPI003521EA45